MVKTRKLKSNLSSGRKFPGNVLLQVILLPSGWKKKQKNNQKEEKVLSLAKSTKIKRHQLTSSQSCSCEGFLGDRSNDLVQIFSLFPLCLKLIWNLSFAAPLVPSQHSPTSTATSSRLRELLLLIIRLQGPAWDSFLSVFNFDKPQQILMAVGTVTDW